MSLQAQHELANSPDFIDRTEQAAITTAIAIMAEASSTPGHAQRANYAQRVLHSSRDEAKKLAHGLATQGGISESSDDVTIKNNLIAIWNAYASYNPN